MSADTLIFQVLMDSQNVDYVVHADILNQPLKDNRSRHHCNLTRRLRHICHHSIVNPHMVTFETSPHHINY